MKKRILWLSLALVVGQAGHAFAQVAEDALQYSRLQFGGPARTLGIGGANVALGADFGNLTSNPAGLGLFQKSEFHFTPGLGLGQADARVVGSPLAAQNETKNSFHIGSAGLVLATRRPDSDQSSNWRGGAFVLGFTRLADFNTAYRYQRTANNNESFLARLRPSAGPNKQAFFDNLDDQVDNNDFSTNLGLAYGAYLANITQARMGSRLDSAVVLRQQGSILAQNTLIVNSGSISQFDLGYGANYRDRLYIGGAIGIVSSNYKQVRTLTETDNDPATHFNSLTSRQELQTKGSGFNARVGLIYRASDVIRVGASVQTPTFMRFTDTYNESLRGNFSATGTDRVPSDLPIGDGPTVSLRANDYAYTLTTPFRANGGVALTLGKHGFVTSDVEYVGYGQARLHNDSQDANGDDYTFSAENDEIRDSLQSAVNLRVGAEGRFDVFRVRLGYARYGDPYKTDANNERAQNFYTAGVGLRQGNFFIDAAAVYTTFDQRTYLSYSVPGTRTPVVKLNHNRYTTSITAGITF
ncbi:MAG: hypothetical protein JWR44_3536 [Hymenobacter sp.]|jgi:hypothetical protein|nr:hypothetical protein [Hymenobacter sp.]